jgi:hypothetical protein
MSKAAAWRGLVSLFVLGSGWVKQNVQVICDRIMQRWSSAGIAEAGWRGHHIRWGVRATLVCLLAFPGGTAGLTQTAPDGQATDNKAAAKVEELILAAAEGKLFDVRQLIQEGVDVNAKNKQGETALQVVAWIGRDDHSVVEIAQILIKGGAKVDVKDKEGRSPLLLAARFGSMGVMKVLIDAGADAAATDADIFVALSSSADRGLLEMVKMLLPRSSPGARANALTTARMGCHDDIVALLQRAGAVELPGAPRSAPDFKKFPVEQIYKGAPATVDMGSPLAREYRTRLQAGARKGPNFAGHYTIVQWGCGSNCDSITVVDAVSGQVYHGAGNDRGAIFQLDSKLLILDPKMGPDQNAYQDNTSDTLPVRYYTWEQNRLTFLYSEPCWVVNGHQACGCQVKPKADAPQATKSR